MIPGKKGKCQLMFIFKQKIWPEMTSFDVTGSTMVPSDQVAKVMANHKGGPTTVQTLADIKNVIEGWCASLSRTCSQHVLAVWVTTRAAVLWLTCLSSTVCTTRVNDDLRVPGKLLNSVMRQSRCPKRVSPETLDPQSIARAGICALLITLAQVRSPDWRRYGDRGYVFGYIVGFDGMDSGQIVAQVVEGKVSVAWLHD